MLSFTKLVGLVLVLGISLSTMPLADAIKCGGFAGIQCPAGQTCKVIDNTADVFGTCVPSQRVPPTRRARRLGEICSGFAGIKCDVGLKCELPNHTADALGICVLAAAEADVDEADEADEADEEAAIGDSCGGIAGIKCAAGLRCKVPEGTADAMGTCVAPSLRHSRSRRAAWTTCGGPFSLPCFFGKKCYQPNPDNLGICMTHNPADKGWNPA